jgi:Tol biopolymer transport system component
MRWLLALLVISLLSVAGYAQAAPCQATTDSSVNVRAQPDTGAAVLALIIPGNPAAVTGVQEDWYQVSRADFGTGWVSSSVVLLQGDCAAFEPPLNPFILPFDLSDIDLLFTMTADGGKLYGLNLAAGTARPLTTTHIGVPQWSPDGSAAVFTRSGRAGSSDLFWMNRDASEVRPLTRDGKFNVEPLWSPDGTAIAFWSRRDAPALIQRPFSTTNFTYIYVMKPDGSDVRRVIAPPEQPPPWYAATELLQGWTRDGRIVFTSQRDNTSDSVSALGLYRVLPDGSDLANLTGWAGLAVAGNVGVRSAAVSPDGTRIAFEFWAGGQGDLYVMNTDATGLKRLTNDTRSKSNIAWSADGRYLAFEAAPAAVIRQQDIFVLHLDDLKETLVTPDSPTYDSTPQWSPDGQWIAFVATDDTQSQIVIVHPDGTGRRAVANGSGPQWVQKHSA